MLRISPGSTTTNDKARQAANTEAWLNSMHDPEDENTLVIDEDAGGTSPSPNRLLHNNDSSSAQRLLGSKLESSINVNKPNLENASSSPAAASNKASTTSTSATTTTQNKVSSPNSINHNNNNQNNNLDSANNSFKTPHIKLVPSSNTPITTSVATPKNKRKSTPSAVRMAAEKVDESTNRPTVNGKDTKIAKETPKKAKRKPPTPKTPNSTLSATSTSSSEPPTKKPKVDRRRNKKKDACVNTTSVATLTEPDFLGPCEPGTSVNLEGIVWHETSPAGVLVVNVTWRGKTYVGTLIDCSRHEWAPPRFTDSPDINSIDGSETRSPVKNKGRSRLLHSMSTSDIINPGDSRVPGILLRGGKTRRVPPPTNAIKHTESCAAIFSSTSTTLVSPSSAKRKGKSGSSTSVCESETNSPDSVSTTGNADEEKTPVVKKGGNKRRRTSAKAAQDKEKNASNDQIDVKNDISADDESPHSPQWMECDMPNCNKKYKQIAALMYHKQHAHSSSEPLDDSEAKAKDSASENVVSTPVKNSKAGSKVGSSGASGKSGGRTKNMGKTPQPSTQLLPPPAADTVVTSPRSASSSRRKPSTPKKGSATPTKTDSSSSKASEKLADTKPKLINGKADGICTNENKPPPATSPLPTLPSSVPNQKPSDTTPAATNETSVASPAYSDISDEEASGSDSPSKPVSTTSSTPSSAALGLSTQFDRFIPFLPSATPTTSANNSLTNEPNKSLPVVPPPPLASSAPVSTAFPSAFLLAVSNKLSASNPSLLPTNPLLRMPQSSTINCDLSSAKPDVTKLMNADSTSVKSESAQEPASSVPSASVLSPFINHHSALLSRVLPPQVTASTGMFGIPGATTTDPTRLLMNQLRGGMFGSNSSQNFPNAASPVLQASELLASRAAQCQPNSNNTASSINPSHKIDELKIKSSESSSNTNSNNS